MNLQTVLRVFHGITVYSIKELFENFDINPIALRLHFLFIVILLLIFLFSDGTQL